MITAAASPAPPPPPAPPAPPAPPPPPPPAAAPGGDVYQVWFATNRKLTGSAGDLASYSNQEDNQVKYGKVAVDLPPEFFKRSEMPGWKRFLWGKSTESAIKLRDPVPMSRKDFFAALRQEFSHLTPGEKDALLFVHGYNTSFAEAAQRAAAIGYQLKVPVTAFYSWPSRHAATYYFDDVDIVERSQGAMSTFISNLVRNSGATRVHVIAHSMGNLALMRVLGGPLKEAARSKKFRLGHVILAAPDIATKSFEQNVANYTKVAQRVTLYASSGDLALLASKRFRKKAARAGIIPPIAKATGIDIVDVDKVNLTFTGHAYVADERPVLDDMSELLLHDKPPALRCLLTSDKRGVWVLGKPKMPTPAHCK